MDYRGGAERTLPRLTQIKMAVSCSPSDLVEGAKCYSTCLLNEELSAIELWLLTQIAGTTTDVQTLLNNSKCLENCVEHGNAEAIIVWLLAKIANVNNDPNSLMSAARCIEACIIPEESKAIDVSLEVQIAGATTDLTTLLNNARCFRLCAADWRGIAIKIYLLAIKAGVSTDPATLIGSANCLLGCLNHDQLKLIETYLWCQIANIPTVIDPTTFAGLAHWWRADDLVGIVADGQPVGDAGKEWTDRIAGIKASAAGTSRPVFVQNGINGKPHVLFTFNFSGSQNNMTLSSNIVIPGDYTTVGVFKGAIVSGTVLPVSIFENAAGSAYHRGLQSAGVYHAEVKDDAAATIIFANWVGANLALASHALMLKRSGLGAGNTTAFYNATQAVTGSNNGNLTFQRIRVLNGGFGDSFTAQCPELIHYTQPLSNADLTSLYNDYLKPRYALP